MRPALIALAFGTVLAGLGCHSIKSDFAYTAPPPHPFAGTAKATAFLAPPVGRSFVEVGVVTVREELGQSTLFELVKTLRHRAGYQGCDGVILRAVSRSSSDGVSGIRGSCIMFQDRTYAVRSRHPMPLHNP